MSAELYFAEIVGGLVNRVIVAPNLQIARGLGGTWVPAGRPGRRDRIGPGSSGPSEITVADQSSALKIVDNSGDSDIEAAATDLAYYIEQITGATVSVVASTEDEQAIWVDTVDYLDGKEEVEITVNGWGGVCIVGATARATANAVYEFIETYLDVKWLWPGEDDVPSSNAIVLSASQYRHSPSLLFRHDMMKYSTAGTGVGPDWARRQRLALDYLSDYPRGHAYQDWWENYGETDPGLFAVLVEGNQPQPNAHAVKLNHANPAVADKWIEEVIAERAANPNGLVYHASPNDSVYEGHCNSPESRAWDVPSPPAETRPQKWGSTTEDRPSLSDRHFRYANVLVDRMEEEYPGEEWYIGMGAYGNWRTLPIENLPDHRIIVSGVFNTFAWKDRPDPDSNTGQTFHSQMIQWLRAGAKMSWAPNHTGDEGMAGMHYACPAVLAEQTSDQINEFHREGNLVGASIDYVLEHFASQAPMYYVIVKLGWNPARTYQSISDEFYSVAFGPAADHMRAYWEHCESVTVSTEAQNTSRFDLPDVWTSAVLNLAQGHLDNAIAEVEADSKYERRILFAQAGLDYTKKLMSLLSLMKEYSPSDEANALELWSDIDAIKTANPNGFWSSPIRHQAPRMAGLHPTTV